MPTIRQRLPRIVALLSLLLASLIGPAAPGASAQPPPPQIEIDPQLTTALAADESTGYIIAFNETPDLSPALAMNWRDRGRFVVKQLQATADRSQQRVRNLLQSRGARFRSFWAGNLIVVERSNLATVNALQGYQEITGLYTQPEIILFDDQPATATAPSALLLTAEPNIEHIDAPEAWDLGYTGDGIVVGSIDTGVRYTHQALVSHYRGNQGGGNFNHNYSWWDPYNHSASPVDSNNHGSHTTGTMVGGDGNTNRIGVAPGAQWIACMGLNGTTGSDVALLECGQFMLAPWDLSGASPNPDKRPQVVNNSWGSCQRSYDGWYQGVIDAWVAAGVYPIFSVGNASNCGYSAPPGLNTVGVPGRYGNVTAVGSTGTTNGQYASHSNWGPTDRLDTTNPRGYPNIKPQVVAPGVNIRSSVRSDDSSYALSNGTSMSAPHVAGMLALVWQAAPCLLGNYALSELVIEQSATPIPYATGNGDEGPGNLPNHATGWGEINALAAVQQAQATCGTTGWAIGQVTDASTNQPIANAPVAYAAQSTALSLGTQSNAQGSYRLKLPSGSYTATAQLHGYYPRSDNVSITAGVTSTHNLPLTPIPLATVSGTVRDGGGHGWPLYAKISVTGYESKTVYTNPTTGVYSVTLRQSQAYTFTVETIDADYGPATRAVVPSAGQSTQDFALMPSLLCIAPGYTPDPVYLADFESANGSYSVSGSNATWAWGAPSSGPGAARSGAKLWATSLAGDYANNEDSYLTSPPINLSAYAGRDLYLGWWQWLRTEADFDYASVEISKNGGTSWTPVYGPISGVVDTTWHLQQVALDASYAVANFQLRFAMSSDNSFAYPGWYVDDMMIQAEAQASANQPPPCLTAPGALVNGYVADRNTGDPLNGALVAADGTALAQTTSMATPSDPTLGDGFFRLFVPQTGAVTLNASAPGYAEDTQALVLASNTVVRQDFRLGAPLIGAPETLSVVVTANQQLTRTLTLTNTGSADVDVDLQTYRDKHLAALNTSVWLPTGAAVLSWQQSSPLPQATAFHVAEFVDGQLYVIGGYDGSATSGAVYRYTPATDVWDSALPPLPTAVDSACSAVLGDAIYVIGGYPGSGSTNLVQIFHTATAAWETMSSDPLPAARESLACAASGGKIYAFGGYNASIQSSGWVYDPAASAGSRWSPIAPLPLASRLGKAIASNDLILYAGMVQASDTNPTTVYAYTPASNTWSSYPTLQAGHGYGTVWTLDGQFYVGGGNPSSRVEAYDLAQGATGIWRDAAPFNPTHQVGTGVADPEGGALYLVGGRLGGVEQAGVERLWVPREVAWLNLAQTSVAISQQQSATIPFSVDTMGLALGAYTAQVLAQLDHTPYELAHPATTIQLIVATPGVAAGPSTATRGGAPGSQVAHTLTVTNSGSYTDTFSIAAGAHAWPASLNTSVGPLAPGASATINLSVTVPANALAGSSDSLALTIASGIDPQQQAMVTRTTTTGTIYGLELEPAATTRSGAPGTPVSYTLTLRNIGNTSDTVVVQLSGAQWPTQATPLSVELAPGQQASIVVTVAIPSAARQPQEDSVLLRATSQGSGGVVAEATLRTSAGAHRLYLPMIRR